LHRISFRSSLLYRIYKKTFFKKGQGNSVRFADRLRQERLRRHLSQEELAEALSVSPRSIIRWEQGKAVPQPSVRLQLSRFFEQLPNELFGEEEEQKLWSVPYPRNPFFTGREEILSHMYEQFHQDHTMALTQSLAVSGLGGIGKTQIALEYTYQYRQHYRYVFWSSAATREALLADFTTMADLLQLPEKHESDKNQLIKAVRHWFATHQDWLLVLDNVDDAAMIQDFVPIERPGHVLLTSRAQALGPLAQRIEVETMGITEATLLLLRRSRYLTPDAFLDHVSEDHLTAAETIAMEMDFLPLALDQAGAYIEEVGCSLSAYLELYRAHRKELLRRRGSVPTDHPEPVATTWSLSFQQIELASPAAAQLLQFCAFLEPDAIPEELISEGSAHLGPTLASMATDAFKLNEAIEELRRFSLVHRYPETRLLRIHRLVQAVLKDALETDEQRQWAERAVRAVNTTFPADAEDVSTWPRGQRFLAQAQVCSVLVQDYTLVVEEAAALLARTANYLHIYALYEQAEPLYQQALAIREQILGPEHPSTATGLNDLAYLYWQQSKYKQAEPLYQRALAIYEQQLGANHPKTAKCLNNLVILYGQQGKYAQAETLCQRALAIYEQQSGPDHPDTARSLNNLVILYGQQGKYAQAETLCQRALAIYEQQSGPDHPDTARSLNNLANLYCLQGKYEQAEPLYLRALAIYEQHLGVSHHSIAYLLHGLAELYQHQGKYEQAEPLYLRALAIYEQHLVADHPDMAESLHGLAKLYQHQEKQALAEPLYLRALAIRERELGQQHPETAETLYDLAVFRETQGKSQETVPLYQRALAIHEQVFGPQHPKTMATRERLRALAETD